MTDDHQLLQRYSQGRSEADFAELVRRYIDLVYAAALRVVAGDTHLAQDITQVVFAELARKARSLPPNVILAGWLYRTASFTAAKAVRSERRRYDRERNAMELAALNQHTEPTWEQLAPYLDGALNQLSEADRGVIVLRFLHQQDLRSVGAALGISDDAAQKRVSRALEKLRSVLCDRMSTATLVSVLVVGAASTSAPAGLAASVSAGAAAGTALGATLWKFMSMTKMQTAAAGVIAAATFITPIVLQQRSLHSAQEENRLLRQQAGELAARGEAAEQVSPEALNPEDLQQQPKDHSELLRLRAEVRLLRQQVAGIPNAPATPPAAAGGAEKNEVKEAMRQLGFAASRGDFSALDKLAECADAAWKARTNDQQWVMGDVKEAFVVMQTEAGGGNQMAFEAIWRATRNRHLDGLATFALGEAAALGHPQALEALVQPEQHRLLFSTAVSALRPVAETGNQRALEALAAVAANEKNRAMWYIVANSLEKAALAGNTTAIDGLSAIARNGRGQTRDIALTALENASWKEHARATEALRSLAHPQ